jgi:hypothetical protein
MVVSTMLFVKINCSGVAGLRRLPIRECYSATLSRGSQAALLFGEGSLLRQSPSRRNLVVAAHARPTDSSHRYGQCKDARFAGRLPSRAKGGAKPPSQPLGRALMHDVPLLAPPPAKGRRQHASWGLWKASLRIS